MGHYFLDTQYILIKEPWADTKKYLKSPKPLIMLTTKIFVSNKIQKDTKNGKTEKYYRNFLETETTNGIMSICLLLYLYFNFNFNVFNRSDFRNT